MRQFEVSPAKKCRKKNVAFVIDKMSSCRYSSNEKGRFSRKEMAMELYTVRRGNDIVLMIVPDENDGVCRVKDFARVGEPLVAVIKKDRAYKYPHLEVRKKSP